MTAALVIFGFMSLALTGVVAAGDPPTTPLLAALAYAPLDDEYLDFEFTDWAALKTLHGGTQMTSESPIDARG